ncbi:MAG: hypothetical protein IT437_10690 [Phycisphaerales bacterium]|nr:hypothetical protein [Phycisphaerales bacterium]
MRPRRQRCVNLAFGAAVVLTAALAAGLALSYVRPSWLSVSRLSVGVVRGDVEIGWGSVPIQRTPKLWRLGHPEMTAAVIMAGPGGWKPSSSEGRLASTTGGVTAIMTLRATWVPIWPWLLGVAGLTGVAWSLVRRVSDPGCCTRCGYDLRGGAGSVCPECGAPAGGRVPGGAAGGIMSHGPAPV